MRYMPGPALPDFVLEQRCLLPDGASIEIRLARGARGPAYRLAYLRGGECLLSYERRAAQGDLRVLRGRAAPYAFRSVEQLRYDFERDLETL
jgi:hypothetical protein